MTPTPQPRPPAFHELVEPDPTVLARRAFIVRPRWDDDSSVKKHWNARVFDNLVGHGNHEPTWIFLVYPEHSYLQLGMPIISALTGYSLLVKRPVKFSWYWIEEKYRGKKHQYVDDNRVRICDDFDGPDVAHVLLFGKEFFDVYRAKGEDPWKVFLEIINAHSFDIEFAEDLAKVFAGGTFRHGDGDRDQGFLYDSMSLTTLGSDGLWPWPTEAHTVYGIRYRPGS